MIAASARRLQASGASAVPFSDFEVIPPLDGSPEGIFVWFICESVGEKERSRAEELSHATQRLKAIAVKAGFPKSAAETLRCDVTSMSDIERCGGRFNYFR